MLVAANIPDDKEKWRFKERGAKVGQLAPGEELASELAALDVTAVAAALAS